MTKSDGGGPLVEASGIVVRIGRHELFVISTCVSELGLIVKESSGLV